MPDRDTFLRMIVENPDDDGPRLVFADWLEEQGDSDRAEFIRRQIELARLPAGSAKRPRLERRERALFKAHHLVWTHAVPSWIDRYVFRRGFLDEVAIKAETFLARGDELFSLVPVRVVRLRVTAEHVRRLAASPHFASLSALDVRGSVEAGDLVRVLANRHLGRLRSLAVRFVTLPPRTFPAFLRTIARLPLRHLDLYDTELKPASVQALAGSRLRETLESLVLGGNGLGNDAVPAGPPWPRLQSLHLSFNDLDDSAAPSLQRLAEFPALRDLDLGYNALRTGATALNAVPQLSRLNLRGNPLEGKSRSALRRTFADRVEF